MVEAVITSKQTALHATHLQHKALMVDFAGWHMPLHYGSQIDEHNQVRNAAGMFDVSHMGVIDITGDASKSYLSKLLANDIGKLKQPGQALYSCMLNAAGGVIDDLIVYFLAANNYRLVVNAGTTASDYAWLQQQQRSQQLSSPQLSLKLRTDLAILAIQGPQAREVTTTVLPEVRAEILALKPFHFIQAQHIGADHNVELAEHTHNDYMIARTGYTGEDGVEIILPATKIVELWNTMLRANVAPIGLGARDTLRLEAGLNLYGQDMDSKVTPLESNLAWTVVWQPEDRDFIGRTALQAQRATQSQRQTKLQTKNEAATKSSPTVLQQLVSLLLEDKGILRTGYAVYDGEVKAGTITSGSYSPTLKRSIALARVKNPVSEHYYVEIRGKRLLAKVVKPPFVPKHK